MSTIYPEIKSILDKCGVDIKDNVVSIEIAPMTVTIKRHAPDGFYPYSDGNNRVVMRPDLVVNIDTTGREKPTEKDRQRTIESLRNAFAKARGE